MKELKNHKFKGFDMTEGEIIVPLVIVLGVGIFIGTRIWLMFRK